MSDLFEIRKAIATGGSDTVLAGVERYLASVAQAEREVTARERQAYVELLARLAPPRTGPAPPSSAHALAAPLEPVPPPEPAQVVAILRAAGKTPDDLRADLKLLVAIRDRADLAVTVPACRNHSGAASVALRRFREKKRRALEALQAKDNALEGELYQAMNAYERSLEAQGQLRWDQHFTGEVQRLRAARVSPGCRAPDPERDAREAAAHAADDALIAAAQVRADRLGYLARAFFPPPLEDDRPSQAVFAEWTVTPRSDPEPPP